MSDLSPGDQNLMASIHAAYCDEANSGVKRRTQPTMLLDLIEFTIKRLRAAKSTGAA